jgi:two-component system sensor histidine kinase UhpB
MDPSMLRLRCVLLLAAIPGPALAQVEAATRDTGTRRVVVANDFARAAVPPAQMERIGERSSVESKDPYRPYLLAVLVVVSTALLLIAFLLAWNHALRRGIQRRTAALAESEQIFRQITEHIRDVFWVSTPPLQKIIYCSPAYETIWGRSVESLYADPRSFTEATHAGSRDGVLDAISNGQADFEIEYPITRPDGSKRWIRDRGFPVLDAGGRVFRIVGTCQDMTEQKASEEGLRAAALKLEALSRRLVTLQEDERKDLARELHDRVGQYVTALNINLSILGSQLPEQVGQPLRERLVDCQVLIEATAAAVRNVVSELRPPMLDDHGLVPALEWYAADLALRTGLSIIVQDNGRAERCSAPVEIALFRIAQEALNNVLKHAGASEIDIRIDCGEARCTMTIDDDGVGLDRIAPTDAPHCGLGIVTMRERAQAIGGAFEVRALPGRGTRLSVDVPTS